MHARTRTWPPQALQVVLHPVLPWMAVVTKLDVITIWDWSTKQVRAHRRFWPD